MSATAVLPRLYVAKEDLKDRYKGKGKGMKCLEAYLSSVEKSRKMKIDIALKENGTVEFLFRNTQASREALEEAKQDLQGEVCSDSAAKKYYDQPPRHLPSAHIKVKKVSTEARREIWVQDQARIQDKVPKNKPLTIETLEQHDQKETSGPCELRQFGCPQCRHSWWRTVLKSNPVSRCRGGGCGNARYDALPRDKEFGVGRFICPNDKCGRKFYGFCEATDTLQCRKCGAHAKPYIHPRWRKKQRSKLNPSAKPFNPVPRPQQFRSYPNSQQDLGPQFYPKSQGGAAPFYGGGGRGLADSFNKLSLSDDDSVSGASGYSPRQPKIDDGPPKQPKIPPRGKLRVFNASEKHKSTGGTMSTFLSQVDFNETTGEEVALDYNSDDDHEEPGAGKFECYDCPNEYTVIVRLQDTAPCLKCGCNNRPMRLSPPREINRRSRYKHWCSLCRGKGNCPNLRRAKLGVK